MHAVGVSPNSQCSCHTRTAKDRFGSEAVLMPSLKAAYDDYLADGLGFKVAPGTPSCSAS